MRRSRHRGGLASMTGRTMAADQAFNVLFLCTHNSARSIMAEAIINEVGQGKFKGFSAGSQPASAPNPHALATLRRLDLPTDRLHSKNWDEFAKPDSPVMDFVITVCDNAAGEVCPVWPGQPMTAHWGVEDPGEFQGSDEEKRREFVRVANVLKRRIELFTSLPVEKLDRLSLQRQLTGIGKQ
jgi:arsenate reductase (thioredoxin)